MGHPTPTPVGYSSLFHGSELQSVPGDSLTAGCKVCSSPETVFYNEGFLFFSLQENPEATLTMSLAQTVYCRNHGFDPQSPLCVHIMMSGTVTKVSSTKRDGLKRMWWH